MVKFYVYDLVDPRTGDTFYVGKGQRSRLYQHEKEARKGTASQKCEKIREILADGYSVVHSIIKTFADEVEAYLFEAARISEIGLHNLTNIHAGFGQFNRGPRLPKTSPKMKGWEFKTIRKILAGLRKSAAIIDNGQRLFVGDLDITEAFLRVLGEMARDVGEREFFSLLCFPESVSTSKG